MRGMTGRLRIAGCAVVAAVVVLAAVSTATAGTGGAGTVSFTQTIKDAVQTQADVNPCSGATGTSTMHINNAVFHLTVNANGFWATSTSQGTFSFTPHDPSQPSYFGRFTEWFGDNGNRQSGRPHSRST
jgi:hypothetical protein